MSSTMSESRGSPCLYPNDTTVVCMRSSRDCAEKLATTRSRSSCTVMLDVSITRSAASRSDSSTARSFDIPSSTLSARGCLRFVASNRRISTSSDAVRNTIRYSMPRRARSRRASDTWSKYVPPRTSTTSAMCLISCPGTTASSTIFGISEGGRLSTTKYPRSSSALATSERPAPESPVTIVKSGVSGSKASSSFGSARAMALFPQPRLEPAQDRDDPARDVHRDDGSDLFLTRLKDTAHRAERARELSFALRPDPRDAIEGALGRLPAPKRPVVGDREAVRFVPNVLQQIQRVRAARDPDGLRLPGEVDLLEPLREPNGVDVRQPQLGQDVQRGVQLSLPTVDHDQVRRVVELRRLLARLLTLGQVRGETSPDHLGHAGEVVLPFDAFDRESPVVRFLRQPVLEHDHRRHLLGRPEVRDVVALDAEGRVRQRQRRLQGVELLRARG